VALGQKLRDILDAKSVQARVLVIEDEPLIQMLTMDYLQEVGLKVYVAGSAADALNKLRLIPGGIDAAIIDIILPDRDGASLVREIRSVYPSVPFVITSGRGQEELRSHFKDVPLIAMVSKPYTADELTAAMRALGIRCSG
jgi:two-component system response regulator PhoP